MPLIKEGYLMKGWRWVLTAALALAFVAGATARAGSDGQLVLEETHDISRGGTLVIESGQGGVVITGERRTDVHIEVWAEDIDVEDVSEMLHLDVREISRGLQITVDIKERRSFFGRSRGRVWVEVSVPRATDLDIDNNSGGVSVRDIDANVRVDNGSGGVRLDGIEGDVDIDNNSGGVSIRSVRGDLMVDNGSGGIKATDVQGDVSIDNNSGGVKLTAVDGRLEVDNGSGGINVELTGRNQGVEVESNSGGVILGIPRGWGADLDLRSSSSSITIHGFSHIDLDDVDRFRGSVGGGGPSITVSSGSGQVVVIAE